MLQNDNMCSIAGQACETRRGQKLIAHSSKEWKNMLQSFDVKTCLSLELLPQVPKT